MSIKQAIEALELCRRNLLDGEKADFKEWAQIDAALAALRSMPAEPVAAHAEFVGKACKACERGEYFLDSNGYNSFPRCDRCDSVPSLGDYAKNAIATPHTAPVLTEAEIRKWWSSEHGLEDMDMCKIDDFRTVVRAIEAEVLRRGGGV